MRLFRASHNSGGKRELEQCQDEKVLKKMCTKRRGPKASYNIQVHRNKTTCQIVAGLVKDV